jgi:hypothetical protein
MPFKHPEDRKAYNKRYQATKKAAKQAEEIDSHPLTSIFPHDLVMWQRRMKVTHTSMSLWFDFARHHEELDSVHQELLQTVVDVYAHILSPQMVAYAVIYQTPWSRKYFESMYVQLGRVLCLNCFHGWQLEFYCRKLRLSQNHCPSYRLHLIYKRNFVSTNILRNINKYFRSTII